jgi:aconitase B
MLTHSNFNYVKTYNKIKSEKAKQNVKERAHANYHDNRDEILLQMKIQKFCKSKKINRDEFSKLVSIYGYEEVKKMFK